VAHVSGEEEEDDDDGGAERDDGFGPDHVPFSNQCVIASTTFSVS
jgi:hypothetical protein